jgi:hypothetical protein
MVNKQISNLFQAQNPAIASYDWVDIANGAGYVKFYIGFVREGDQILRDNVFVSYSPSSYTASVSEIYSEEFNLKLNSPRTLNGLVHFEFPYGIKVADDYTKYATIKTTIVLKRNDETIQTEEFTMSMSDKGTGNWGTSTLEFYMQNGSFEVDNVQFGKGDTLILDITCEVTAMDDHCYVVVGHSPTDDLTPPTHTGYYTQWADDASSTTISTISLPFKIDI